MTASNGGSGQVVYWVVGDTAQGTSPLLVKVGTVHLLVHPFFF
jgi:hypothetical protein